jgi:hypothetical protein
MRHVRDADSFRRAARARTLLAHEVQSHEVARHVVEALGADLADGLQLTAAVSARPIDDLSLDLLDRQSARETAPSMSTPFRIGRRRHGLGGNHLGLGLRDIAEKRKLIRIDPFGLPAEQLMLETAELVDESLVRADQLRLLGDDRVLAREEIGSSTRVAGSTRRSNWSPRIDKA